MVNIQNKTNTSCKKCSEHAVYDNPRLCKKHFIIEIETRVKETIRKFKLIKKGERIAVAVSGGKDSQTVLYILRKFYGKAVFAVAIDEGIEGYRSKTLEDLKKFCSCYDIHYKLYSFKNRYHKSLDQLVAKGAAACRTCGVLRRHLLNFAAKDFDKIATGHNLDDECQNFVMNLFKGTSRLSAKLGPASGIKRREGLTQRIKPLYFCSERETTAYAYLNGFPVTYIECPYAQDSFRSHVRDMLNILEAKKTGTKRAIIGRFITILPALKETAKKDPPLRCSTCGGVSAGKRCKNCLLADEILAEHKKVGSKK